MRTSFLIVGLYCTLSNLVPPSMAQPEEHKSPVLVTQGVVINYFPQEHLQFTSPYTAPEDALVCDPADQRAACGKALWNDSQLPLDTRYTTTIPAVIGLVGPSEDIIFTPFVRCIITDKNGKRRTADEPGIECRTILEDPGDYLRWAFGGSVDPVDALVHGTYTGTIPVTVMGIEKKWEFDMPISLDVKKKQVSCMLRGENEAIFPEVSLTQGDPSGAATTINVAVIYDAGDGRGGDPLLMPTRLSHQILSTNIPELKVEWLYGSQVKFSRGPIPSHLLTSADTLKAVVSLTGSCTM